VATSNILCPHFHIPLQSGDDDVLQRMNRHYSSRFFTELVQKIAERLPEAAIGLDVITGFPGETEQEFENTRRLIEELPISHLHVFPYSRRPGTPAAALPAQVPGPLARERAAQLRLLGERKSQDFARRFLGRQLQVVVEGGRQDGLCKGLSGNYLQVAFPGPDGLEGQLLSLTVESCSGQVLQGHLG
jgi:threonylcarbamoyladenosine tRNA methylthiotransferase MtaB